MDSVVSRHDTILSGDILEHTQYFKFHSQRNPFEIIISHTVIAGAKRSIQYVIP